MSNLQSTLQSEFFRLEQEKARMAGQIAGVQSLSETDKARAHELAVLEAKHRHEMAMAQLNVSKEAEAKLQKLLEGIEQRFRQIEARFSGDALKRTRG